MRGPISEGGHETVPALPCFLCPQLTYKIKVTVCEAEYCDIILFCIVFSRRLLQDLSLYSERNIYSEAAVLHDPDLFQCRLLFE